MLKQRLPALATTVSFLAISASWQPAVAQSDQPAASANGIEEVVVTARRKEEKSQSVPITITSFTQQALQEQSIRTANDLNKDIPSIQLCCNRGAVSFAWIRGVPGVLGYFDQVPTVTNNSIGLNGSAFYYDMASVQVLKGPQGTLFGLSTNGGAILFESRKPTSDYNGYFQIGAGNYGHFEAEGAINVPIVPDKLLVRAGGQYEMTDGYVHDVIKDRDYYSELYGVGRVSVTFRPVDSLQNDLVVNYYRSHSTGTAFVWTEVNPAGLAGLIFANAPFIGTDGRLQTGFINAFNQQLKLGKYATLGSDINGDSFNNSTQLNIVNTTTWDLTDDITIKNIFGYQEIENAARTDTDGTPFPILDGRTVLPDGTNLPITQITPDVNYTEELQLQGKAFGEKLSYTIGTFNEWTALRSPDRPGYTSTLGGVNGSIIYRSSRTNGLYAQGTYDLSDFVQGLSFTGGYRYTWDKREFRQDSYAGATQTITKSVGLVGNFHPAAPGSYTLSLDYQYTPSTLFYVTDSKGFSTGGFNNNAPPGFQEFQPETLDNVEVGVKSDWELAGVKARTNLSAYYGFYTNIQTMVTSQVPNPSGGAPLLQVLTENSASAHIEGLETSITLIPVPAFEFTANAAYNVAAYDKYTSLAAGPTGKPIIEDLSGTPFVSDPKWSLDLHGTYHLPVDESLGDMRLTAVWSYEGSQINTSALIQYPIFRTPGFDNLDLNFDWKRIMGNEALSGTLWGTNVLANPRTNGPFGVYTALGLFGITPKAPPMFGFRVRYDFGGPSEEPTPAAAYTPPPAQPVAPAPHSYLVFFDFNKSDLTAQASQIVDQAASNATPAHATRLTVTGHTDTVGSDAYNMRLSRRRAESVAARLEKDGIPSSDIEIVARGKRDLLVPTADGVREPQNRRVQILYDGGQTS